MDDTISRQMALDELWKLRRAQQMMDATQAADPVMQGIFLAEKKIENLPFALRWIPVTERLPEEEKDVLCFTIHQTMLVASYGKLYPLSDEVGWITNEYNRLRASSVIAWMPLPKPYERGQDD